MATWGSYRLQTRARVSAVLGGLYILAAVTFWAAGAATYMSAFTGAARFLGLLYVPILLLPFVAHGSAGVHGSLWIWWFAAQLALGAAAVWIYPYDRRARAANRFKRTIEPIR